MLPSLPSLLLLSFVASIGGFFIARLPRGWPYLAAVLPASLFAFFLAHADGIVSGEVVTATLSWVPSLNVHLGLRLDGFSLLFVLLITGIGTLVVLYAVAYFSTGSARRRGRLIALILLFMTVMLGTVLSDDLVVMFVFWEATSLTSFMLIGFESKRGQTRRAALQSLLITGSGGLALFAAIVLIGMELGTFSMTAVTARADELVESRWLPVIMTLILAGAFTKSAQFPVHFWLPRAMVAPTPASAYLHSATMVKLGVYLLARFDSVFADVPVFGEMLLMFGMTTMLIAAFNAIRATGYKAVLAHSTVASLGILVALIGLRGPTSTIAVCGFILSHALYKAALFFCAGTVIHATQIPELRRLGGLMRALPLTAAAAVLASLSMAGLPPFFGFIAKESLLEAKLDAPSLLPIITALIVNAVMVAVAAVVSLRPFFSRKADIKRVHHGETPGLLAGPLTLSVLGILFGLAPGAMAQALVAAAATAVHGAPVDVSLALWHGVSPVLALSVTVVAAGALLAWHWDAFHDIVNRPRLLHHINANRFYHRSVNAVLGVARASTRWLQNGDQRRYTLLVSITVVLVSLYAVIGTAETLRLEPVGPVLPLPVFLLLLGVVAAVVATSTRSLITGLLGAGVFGYASALIFLLNGAPDLALTQFAVETLMLVVMTALLLRVPALAPRTRTGRERGLDMVVAAGFAVLVFIGLASMTAQPFDNGLAEFFGATSYLQAFGRNVVNVILVDFRALDTLGEVSVVAFATLAAWALLGRHAWKKGD